MNEGAMKQYTSHGARNNSIEVTEFPTVSFPKQPVGGGWRGGRKISPEIHIWSGIRCKTVDREN